MEESLLLTKDQNAEERAFREVRYDAIHCQSLRLNYIRQSSYFWRGLCTSLIIKAMMLLYGSCFLDVVLSCAAKVMESLRADNVSQQVSVEYEKLFKALKQSHGEMKLDLQDQPVQSLSSLGT